MSVLSNEPERFLPSSHRGRVLSLVALAALGLIAIGFVGPALMPVGHESYTARLSTIVYPNSLTWTMQHADEDDWLMPADAVAMADVIVVADAGNNRLLKLDTKSGTVVALGSHDDDRPALEMPMDIATDGEVLFVANSLGGNVVVLDLSGRLQRVLPLPADQEGRRPRPIGVAVAQGGDVVVSDAEYHRVLRLDPAGTLVWSIGTGTRATGAEGFNVPAALAVDDRDNIYVVDTLNARVVRLSSSGRFMGQVGERGDTAGTLSRPKGVAVDSAGHVFVSDGLLAAIEVFDSDGTYLGLIGRREPDDANSASVFMAPAGISLEGDRLLVTDRHAGLLSFDLGSP